MEEEFWQTRWREQRIAFHENRPNDLLEQHVHRLDLNPGDRVFLPLCGKAVDLDWLADKQLQIVGVEFNQGAVEEVFARRGLTPEVGSFGALTAFQAANLILFVGDFFELTREMIGPIDAIYDRAALVALPDETRSRYVKTLPELTGSARQLLISYDYDQSQTEGPPFS
ncbi:MAG: thiopurine S-methyltransferase, partial [Pseudomonadota bacterium]